MKKSITVWLLGTTILIAGCQKNENILQPINTSSLASINATSALAGEGTDVVTGYFSGAFLADQDIDQGGPGLYYSPMEPDYVHQVNYYYGKIEISAPYRTRNVQPMVTIFYQYDYSRIKGRIYKIHSPDQGGGEGKLSFIGTPGDISEEYVNGGMNSVTATSPYQTLIADGNAVYGAKEKRTIVRSYSGEIKVELGWKAGNYEVGGNLGGGFIVQSATNETGVHSGEVTYSLKVAAGGWGQGQWPVFQRTTTINGAFYGTLKN